MLPAEGKLLEIHITVLEQVNFEFRFLKQLLFEFFY
jgi:hypothetical protein